MKKLCMCRINKNISGENKELKNEAMKLKIENSKLKQKLQSIMR
jgi:hypothetical protein